MPRANLYAVHFTLADHGGLLRIASAEPLASKDGIADKAYMAPGLNVVPNEVVERVAKKLLRRILVEHNGVREEARTMTLAAPNTEQLPRRLGMA